MKKMTLDETWDKCLRMWKWIAKEEKRKGNRILVDALKQSWLLNHGYQTKDIEADCFFCEYCRTHESKNSDSTRCVLCPGKKVDKSFHCASIRYHYAHRPIAFYKKICELNRIRLKGKKR